jgi:hypothetical protein
MLSGIIEVSPATEAEADGSQQPWLDHSERPFPRHTRSFFGAQVNDQHKQIGQGAQDQMVMEAAPGTSLIMVKSQVVFDPLKILLDMVTRTAQPQASRLGRLLVKMG